MSKNDDRIKRTQFLSGTVTDIEDPDQDNFRQMTKKLTREKTSLKDRLKKLLIDVENNNKEHKQELEKTHDFFQKQINDLAKDRKRMQGELQEFKNSFSGSSESHSDDKSFISELQKCNNIIRSHQKNIQELEERLKQKDYEINNIKEKNRNDNSSMEESFIKMRDAYTIIKRDFEKLTIEKESINNELFRRDEQIAILGKDKEKIFNELLKNSESIEKKYRLILQERETEIKDLKSDVNKINLSSEDKNSTASKIFIKKIEELKESYEFKIMSMDSNYKNQIDQLTNNIQDEKKRNYIDCEEKIKKLKNFYNSMNEKNETEVKILKVNNEDLKGRLLNNESEIRDIYSQKYSKLLDEHQSKFNLKEKECNEYKLVLTRIEADCKEKIDNLDQQNYYLKNSIKKLQENSQSINIQFVENLNKQKELAEKEISDRDNSINQLKNDLKKIHVEYMFKVQEINIDFKNTTNTLKDLKDKYVNSQNNISLLETNIKEFQNQILKQKQNINELLDKQKVYECEKNILEKKLQNSIEDYNKKTISHDKYEIDIARYKENESNNRENITNLKCDLNSIQKDLTYYKENYNKRNYVLENKIVELEKELETYKNIKEDVKKLEDKIIEITSEKNKYENSNLDLTSKLEDNQTCKTEIENELKIVKTEHSKCMIIQIENFKLKTTLEKSQSDLETLQKDLQVKTQHYSKSYEKLVMEHNSSINECAKLKNDIDISNQNITFHQQKCFESLKECKKYKDKFDDLYKDKINCSDKGEGELLLKNREIEELKNNLRSIDHDKNELKKTSNDLYEKFISVQKELEIKIKECSEIKLIQKESEYKDEQIKSLNSQLIKIHDNYNQNISKIKDQRNKVTDEYNILKQKEKMFIDQAKDMDILKSMISSVKNNSELIKKESENNHKKDLETVHKKLQESTDIIVVYNKNIENIRNDGLIKLQEKEKLLEKEKLVNIQFQKENIQLQTKMSEMESKMNEIQHRSATASAMIDAKNQLLKQREEELKKIEENIRNTPPKILDLTIKKARDEALSRLRKKELEIAKLKEEINNSSQKLYIVENMVKESENEKKMIVTSQTDLKNSFIDSLNRQQHKHEKEINEKNERIKELEKVLLDNIKK